VLSFAELCCSTSLSCHKYPALTRASGPLHRVLQRYPSSASLIYTVDKRCLTGTRLAIQPFARSVQPAQLADCHSHALRAKPYSARATRPEIFHHSEPDLARAIPPLKSQIQPGTSHHSSSYSTTLHSLSFFHLPLTSCHHRPIPRSPPTMPNHISPPHPAYPSCASSSPVFHPRAKSSPCHHHSQSPALRR
jgi:hypothetical protein